MTGWRDAMNADILAFFDDVNYPDAEVIDIDVDTEDRGPGCRSCSWTVFVVQVAFRTDAGRVTRTHEGSITDFLRDVWETAEQRRTESGAETDDDEFANTGDYGWGHRRRY